MINRLTGRGARGREAAWWSGALLVVVALAVADAVVAPGASLGATFAVAPFLAATGARPLQAAGVGAASVIVAIASIQDGVAPGAGAVRVGVVVLASLVAVFAAQRRVRREDRLAALGRVAEIAQQAILVPVPARLGPFAFASAYASATEEAQLGGDFFEVIETPHGVRLVLGDVRGKGIDGVSLAALVLRHFREAALTSPTIEEVAAAVDRDLAGHAGLEEFVTALLVQLDDHGMCVVNCGHHPPAVVRPRLRSMDELASTTPLGLEPEPVATRVALGLGERVLLYTDGLVEAREPDGRFVRLEELAGHLSERDPATALRRVIGELQDRVGGRLDDDLAVLLIEYSGDGDRPAPAGPWRLRQAAVRG